MRCTLSGPGLLPVGLYSCGGISPFDESKQQHGQRDVNFRTLISYWRWYNPVVELEYVVLADVWGTYYRIER
jgi:hypothetical protein